MNSIQSLTENGIEQYTAKKMIEDYKSKIGTMNGVYRIADITYDFEVRGRIVTMQCSECGNIIHRTMISGRNKWGELIKSCECQKALRAKTELENSEKLKKQKRDIILQKVGEQYGDYIICGLDEENKFYLAKCDICGAKRKISVNGFDNRKNFRCRKHYNPVKYDDSYIGQRYNYLEVVDIARMKSGERRFVCRCDCGNIKTLIPTNVANGAVKSCGCMQSALSSENSRTHGLSGTRIYGIWNGMRARCLNKESQNYENYGGRGIRICDEWVNGENGLLNFISWATSHGYSDNLTIDRIDVNGNYEPDNCRWADYVTQANNRRPSSEWKKKGRKFEIDGAEYSMCELCENYGTSEPAVRYRMKAIGMTLEQALKTPKIQKGRPRKDKV